MLHDANPVLVLTLLTWLGHVRTELKVQDAILHALHDGQATVVKQQMLDERLLRRGVDSDESEGYGHMRMHNLFGNFRKSLESEGSQATAILEATQKLVHIYHDDVHGVLNNPVISSLWPKLSAQYCSPRVPKCIPSSYRTIDGSCNNLKHPTWGMADRAQLRLLPPAYHDGINMPRMVSVTGELLPSPRLVSNFIHRPNIRDKLEIRNSIMLMQWGQLMDHDFADTPMIKGSNGADIRCCDLPAEILKSRHACFTIPIPYGDPVFKKRCMNFVRSVPAKDDNCMLGPRQQMNQVTSYIDAGYLYGVDEEMTRDLRAFQFGFMKMTHLRMYYPDADQNSCMREAPGDYCMKSGDKRIHVVPGLGSAQILNLREHNRIAAVLGKINPHWNDEIIYQETRKIVIALNQHITYGEYLERIIGPDMMKYFGLYIRPRGFNTVYNPNIDATIANGFAAAAFRFGHSLVPGNVNHFFKNTSRRVFDIEQTFTRPTMLLADRGRGSDHVTRWLINEPAGKADRFIEPGLRDNLFLDSRGNSFDLASLNMQRGRDHGIPGYNAWRRLCGLPRAHRFEDLEIDPETMHQFAKVYRHVDDIDLFPGGLAEMHVKGGSVGPTFACILGRQFKALKYGDRFWYENDFPDTGFTEAQLDSIKSQLLSHMICRHQPDQFVPVDSFSIPSNLNPHVPCSKLPDINLWNWLAKPHGKDIKAVRPPYSFMTKAVRW